MRPTMPRLTLILISCFVALFLLLDLISFLSNHNQLVNQAGSDYVAFYSHLNSYEYEKVEQVWSNLKTKNLLPIEKKFFQLDLIFPIFFLILSTLCIGLIVNLSKFKLGSIYLYLSVVIASLTDLAENTLLLYQIDQFTQNSRIDRCLLSITNFATSSKLIFLSLTVIEITILFCFLLINNPQKRS